MASWPAFLHLLPAPRPVRGAISLAGLSADQDNIRRAFKKIRFHMIANTEIASHQSRSTEAGPHTSLDT
jgi:hypothetical protein